MTFMSKRSSCFDCGSSDGLAVYSDGTYCHACHKQTKSRNLFEEIKQGVQEMKDHLPHVIELPQDLGVSMPPSAEEWLQKYITTEEIETFSFWSAKYNRICFPYYIRPEGKESSEMIMCWMRTLEQPTKMKWLFVGDNTIMPFYIKTEFHKLHNPNRVCLVEDVISGVKVSKYINTIVLGSTVIGPDSPIWQKLSKFDEIVLFLDGDTAGKNGAEKLRNQLKLLYKVRVIRNTKDPKNYTDAELMDFIYD